MLESCSISRRSFGIASAISSLSGCGFGSSAPIDYLAGITDGLRILTPWGSGIRNRFAEEFSEWSSKEGFAPVSIRWLPVADSDLAKAPIRHLIRIADLILGGRLEPMDETPAEAWMLANLKPIRSPVLRLRTSQGIGSASQIAAYPKINEIASIIRSGRMRTGDIPLALSDQPGDALTLAYLLAAFEDAPDQAAGYARWIRIVGTSSKLESLVAEPQVSLSLADRSAIDRQTETPWTGGEGTSRALGIPETEKPAYWPENAVWRNDSKQAATIRQLMEFCLRNEWALSVGPMTPNPNSRDVFRNMMAEVLRIPCGDTIRNVWNALHTARNERFAEVESYMASRPPWPPASVIEMRTIRGFEYVVALAEQLAIDEAQRDWLIQEFGKPESETDFRMLETGDQGRLADSTRFCSWLNAEWTAWVRQRCRRAVRYLNSGDSLRLISDPAERKGPSTSP